MLRTAYSLDAWSATSLGYVQLRVWFAAKSPESLVFSIPFAQRTIGTETKYDQTTESGIRR